MVSERDVAAAVGSTVYGTNGERIGRVESFFADDRTGVPTWVAVSTGLFGTRSSIVPATGATFEDGVLRVPVTAEAVKSAPHLAGDHLDPAEEAQLRTHYGVAAPVQPGLAAPPASDDVTPAAGLTPQEPVPSATTGRHRHPEDDDGGVPESDGAMTRTEERLLVDTETMPSGRVRLVKYVVTEEVQITVPIRREEIRLEEIPLDGPDPGPGESLAPAERVDSPADGAGLPDEIVLHTERPVVGVEVVPTERVRLRTELVEGQETVTRSVQRERIAVDESPMPGVSPT
jgi:stress response protein YsnF